MSLRVGHGFDVHPFSEEPDRRLVLGGVEFEGPGLVGHSDADVLAHACTDAILSPAGLGDIGSLFPDTDPGLGTQMKSVGEAMAIGRTFKEALQKALRSLEIGRAGLGADGKDDFDPELVRQKIIKPHADRIFWLRHAIQAGLGVETVAQLSGVDAWFLRQIEQICSVEGKLRAFNL